jgi:DNA-binding NarL/FixJ family response regulator
MPCACAFQVITSFAEPLIPYGHSWEMDDGGTMDIPEPEPVDLSDARGWELAISLMRATEESLWPLLELFLVLILTMDTSQPMLFRFLRLGVLAYLMFQCSSDAWQIRLSRTQI